MQLRIFKKGLAKIIRLCKRNGFFNIKRVESSLISIQYGALGSLLRKNISREWLSSALNNSDVCVFPLEVQSLDCELKLGKISKQTDFLISNVFNQYIKILPIIGQDASCGFAAYGPSLCLDNKSNKKVEADDSLLSIIQQRYWLCFVFLCPSKEISIWFNYWTRHRYRWWRKFSSIPSKFSMSEVTELESEDQEISLMMEFPWGKEKLETITSYNEISSKDWYSKKSIENSLNSNFSTIVCETELNLAAFAYLTNSFAEKWRKNELKNLFHLNVKLAPYKVSISLRSDNPDSLKKLQNVAQHVEKELKKSKVTIFPCLHIDGDNSRLKFNRFDEMGIPYTIILSERTLQSGIAGLRNRDTTLEELIHMTELTPKLLRYLQINSLSAEDNL